jgi:flavin-dependent dehydrogenase
LKSAELKLEHSLANVVGHTLAMNCPAWNLSFKLKTVQHSIRRYEFDDWLLKRSGVPVHTHYVKDIRQEDGHYVIDGEYRCKYLVGAGGTKCPVYRTFFRKANPRAKELQVVTLEQEFPYDWQEKSCHLWFFDRGLPGYSWYVPKENGYLNVGIGGIANKLKQRRDDIKNHWEHLTAMLGKKGLVKDYPYEPKGYSYYLRGQVDTIRTDNAFIVGDAVGLATRDLGEGIGPAVKSGILAADAIIDGQHYSLDKVIRRSVIPMLFKHRKADRRPLPQQA